ncbi:MAG: outer-membrane lipoprotein carrier protein LolA [Elusimicrobiaceae bacterium]|nr:outer-membrane lipoprotein carrier protein LolA [Elusimicrobiaceae bacterium]
MKLSINKGLWALVLACGVSACSNSAEPTLVPETLAQPQQTLAETAPVKQEKPVAPAPETTPAPAPKPTAEKTKAVKTFSAEELVEELKAWDKKLTFLSTSFEQSTSYDGVLVSQSQGTLSYDKAKNFLRLDTLDKQGEAEQSAITDKKEIIILDNAGNQVTTLSWTDWQEGQPNQALYDFGNYTALVNRHQASLKSQTEAEAVLLLTPKTGEEYKLYLTLDKADFFPKTIAIEADLMLTRAELKNTRKNQSLPADTFGGFFQ